MQVNTGIYCNDNENNDSKRQNLDKKSYPNKAQLFINIESILAGTYSLLYVTRNFQGIIQVYIFGCWQKKFFKNAFRQLHSFCQGNLSFRCNKIYFDHIISNSLS